jgi:hypothetical protein
MRSKSISHAAIEVSGKAAASANDNEMGLSPTIRSSTTMKLRVGPGAIHCTRIENLIARREERDLASNRVNHACHVVAQHLLDCNRTAMAR